MEYVGECVLDGVDRGRWCQCVALCVEVERRVVGGAGMAILICREWYVTTRHWSCV